MRTAILTEAFQPGRELERFSAGVTGAGAVVSFSGIVRDRAEGGLVALELEHYPGMTERRLQEIALDAMDRFALVDAMILHRVGRMNLGEPIMMVATAAAHRAEAFAAAEFLMDFLKSRAPFWKKEHFRDGTAIWVAAREHDEDALLRWRASS